MNLWETVAKERLSSRCSMSTEKFGFMPGRSTTGAIFALKLLTKKFIKHQRQLNIVLINLEKAYDRVPRTAVVLTNRVMDTRSNFQGSTRTDKL